VSDDDHVTESIGTELPREFTGSAVKCAESPSSKVAERGTISMRASANSSNGS
jgi:hypothetical protein